MTGPAVCLLSGWAGLVECMSRLIMNPDPSRASLYALREIQPRPQPRRQNLGNADAENLTPVSGNVWVGGWMYVCNVRVMYDV